MAGEQIEDLRVRHNVTFCVYCLMVLRVAVTRGEFIIVELGVGLWLVV